MIWPAAGLALFVLNAAATLVLGMALQTPDQGITLTERIIELGGWGVLILENLVLTWAIFRPEPKLVTGGRYAECVKAREDAEAENKQLWREKVEEAKRAALIAETYAGLREQDRRRGAGANDG